MISQWKQVDIPTAYWIRDCEYKCIECGSHYRCNVACGDELVKFLEDGGTEVRWLPTFVAGGYLELLEKMVPGYSKNQEITMPIARFFEFEFRKHQELSANGNSFSFVGVGCRCPKCASRNADLLSEKIIESPPLVWLRYR